MKKIIYLLLFYPMIVFGQKDTLKVDFSEEKGKLEKAKFLENAEYDQFTSDPIKQLWKAQIGSMLNSRSHNENYEYNLSIGYERLLFDKISLSLLFDRWKLGEGWKRENYSLIVEPRYYFKNRKKSNLSGMYIGAAYQKFIPEKKEEYMFNINYNNSTNIVWGIQNRFFKRGLVNLSLRAGLENNDLYKPIWKKPENDTYYRFTNTFEKGNQKIWFIKSEARIGFGFPDRGNKLKPTFCDVFKCYEAKNHWLKINLNRMFYISEEIVDFDFKADFEYKIRKSPWSINHSFQAYFTNLNIREISYGNSGESLNSYSSNYLSTYFSAEPRYYYSLKKRIKNGKSANNLSGPYISSINGFMYNPTDETNKIRKIHTGLVYGIQHQLLDNSFFDINGGIGKTIDGTWVDSLFPRNSGLYLVLNFKIGVGI